MSFKLIARLSRLSQEFIDNSPNFTIRSISDFPNQAINGVIYLEADTVYTYVGIVDLHGLRIVCKGRVGFIGLTSENSFLTSSGLGAGVPLITATAGTGILARSFGIWAAASLQAGSNQILQLQIRRYNSAGILQESSISPRATTSNNNRAESIPCYLSVTMQPNDYIEVWVANGKNTNVTATELILMVR